MRALIFLLFVSTSFYVTGASPVKVRRICKNNNDNTILWFSSTDPCASFSKYYIYARNGASGPFSLLDSISDKNTESYLHSGANIGGAKKWFYYILTVDSCSPPYSASSVIDSVDEVPALGTYLDSVSVDITTGKSVLGWSANKYIDFFRYNPYRTDGLGNYVEVATGGTRDTFVIDTFTGANPLVKSLIYDIRTIDSCSNPSIFNENPHHTIFLQVLPDTCKKLAQLTWSPYSEVKSNIKYGWTSVRKYYIFKKTEPLPFLLIDSVDGDILSYIDSIVLGKQIHYFIRAIKDTTILVTSSSNQSVIISRERHDSLNTYLANVSVVDPAANEAVEIKVFTPSSEEWSKFDVYRADGNASFGKILEIGNNGSGSTFFTGLDILDPSKNQYSYFIKAIDICGAAVSISNVSSLILVVASPEAQNNKLSWSHYRGWDTGVEKYRVYRGINVEDGPMIYQLIDSVSGTDSGYIDRSVPDKIGNAGICYYLQAVQFSGSPTGLAEFSFSNHYCIVSDLNVFIPNAFRPLGVNKFFKPEGTSIDYKRSTMEIYDRWGGIVFSTLGIGNGWDGKLQNGEMCKQGVYFYILKLQGTNGEQQTKKGTLTLID